VIAVEIDPAAVGALNEMFGENPDVSVIRADIMKTDLTELLAGYGGMRFKIVANLPYYITTPVIMKLLECETKFESITIMVQKEVAERMTARPSTKAYGAFTLAVGYHAEVYIAAYVPPNCFTPRPKVDSAVVCLKPRPEPPVKCGKDILFRIIRFAFHPRRKPMGNALSAGNGGDTVKTSETASSPFDKNIVLPALEKTGFPPDVRGEALSLGDFAKLAEAMDAFVSPK
jgi:16S rRNA (adenine1518-N6/adenine1519-N6)-dimethyltransferase